MSELVSIRDGDFAVIVDGYLVECRQIIKISSRFIFWKSPHNANAQRVSRDKIIFSGSETIALRLVEQLRSSRAQRAEEEKNVILRYRKRNEKFVAEAEKKEAQSK